jgi:hypothetical protein
LGDIFLIEAHVRLNAERLHRVELCSDEDLLPIIPIQLSV